MDAKSSESEALCLACGLCCNGVIFADVQLQPGDKEERLGELGLQPKARGGKIKFNQPCPAFNGQCRIYAERPGYCCQFECALLKHLKAGREDLAGAKRAVGVAQRRAEKVRRLLRELGETEETLALSKRFRRVQKRMESGAFSEEEADLFGQLTLAVQDLNFFLSKAFYPGE